MMDPGSLAVTVIALVIVLVIAALPLFLARLARREEIERRVRAEIRQEEERRRALSVVNPERKPVRGFVPPRPDQR